MVFEKLRAGQRVFLRIPIRVAFEVDGLETVGGIARRAAGGNGNGMAGCHPDTIAQLCQNEMPRERLARIRLDGARRL